MAAYDFPDTAGKPTDGSFDYTAPDGTLYEWNGYAWVVPTDESGGGSGGAARVLTQVLPPSPAEDGDMYWCTDDGRLYLYYDDADTKQWVDASPDGGGNNVEKLIAGDNITLSPANGKGVVTINSTGGGGGGSTDIYGTSKAWAKISNTGTIAKEYNIDRVFVNSNGNSFTCYFKEPMPYADYVVEATVSSTGSGAARVRNQTVDSFDVVTSDWDGNVLGLGFGVTVHDNEPVTVSGGGGGTTVNYNGASAWGNVGINGEINSAFNVKEVNLGTTGVYQVVFTTPMPNANYSVQATCRDDGARQASVNQFTVNGFTLRTFSSAGDASNFPFTFAVQSTNAITPQSGVGADAWGSINGGGTIAASYNVSSVAISGGNNNVYTVSFTTPMPNAKYSVNATAISDGSVNYSVGISAKTINGFTYITNDATNNGRQSAVNFAVHASSTVTPTYTWTRDGTTLKPANDGDDIVVDGAGIFKGYDESSDDYGINLNKSLVVKRPSAEGVSNMYFIRCSAGPLTDSSNLKFFVKGDGSAEFAGDVRVGNLLTTSTTTTGVRLYAGGYVKIQRTSATAGNAAAYEVWHGNNKTVSINANGSATFAGNVTANGKVLTRNVEFQLEADDDTKYTATTNEEGEQTLVYNGATLDVKALLLTLQTAAARITTLEETNASLEARLTALEGGNN